MTNKRWMLVVAWVVSVLLGIIEVSAQTGIRESRQTNGGGFTQYTRWVFRVKSDVKVDTTIIRLGDVVQPVNSNLTGWEQLAQSPVGLVPLSGKPMTIDRDRLSPIILSSQPTASAIRAIDWIGEKNIRVAYVAPDQPDQPTKNSPQRSPSSPSQAKPSPTQPNGAIQSNAIPHSPSSSLAPTQYVDQPQPTVESEPSRPVRRPRSSRPLSASDVRRITHLIELAVGRFLPELAEEYLVEVDPSPARLRPLRRIGGVTHCQLVSEVAEGDCLLEIETRSPTGPITAEILIHLVAHPKVVVPVRSLGKGHRIERSDLRIASLPADRLSDHVAFELDDVIGKEPRSTLRAGQPIGLDKIGAPILVHRGDLIEILVRGGGVTVSTNGKAISSGSRHQLIEVETVNPKKRMIARVADIGVTEIITRPPVVR